MKTKSKFLTIFLCLLTVAFCVFGLAACDDEKCSHQWGEWSVKTNATCTEAGLQERKCSNCDEVETSSIEALGHDWNEATCSTPKICSRCSATEGTASAHTYDQELVKAEALKLNATCTGGALYYKSCSCGAISTNDADTFVSGAALEHKDENTDHICDYGCTTAIGTCEDANKDHICDYGCNKTFGEHSDSGTDNDHVCDYGCGVVLENCSDAENDGNHNCDICGNADVSTHKYGNASCGMSATCSDCGATTGSTLEHKDDNHDHICDNGCGKNDMGTHADSGTDNDHVCDYSCGVVLESCSDVDTDSDHACDVCGKANVSSHAYAENTALATQASCEAAATKTYECNCGDTYTDEDGAALGHNITGVTPTEKHINGCEYRMVYICQRADCGNEVEGETVYHHSYTASITRAATCQEDGEKTLTCSCGDTKTEKIDKNETGHAWTEGTVANGERTDTCSVCQQAKKVIVSNSNSASSSASDFADKDVQLKVDEDTNASIQLGQGVADAIGNKDITISADTVDEDTLKDMGVSEQQLGQIGANTVYDFSIKDGNDQAISDFGENNYVTITLPYMLANGEDVDSIAVWFISDTCQVETCDKGAGCVDAHKLVSIKATYNNGYVTFQTNHFSIYTVTRLTPAQRCELYGHSYVPQHVEGSCTKDEYVLYVCVRCHYKYIDNDTLVVADGHNYTPDTHAATCTENGYILYTCGDCGHWYKTKLNATGHAWSVVASDKASCVADGYTKYGCDLCDEEYTVTQPKLAHTYTNTVIPATCTADGYTLHDCDSCEYSYSDTYIDALGHEYGHTAWTWTADCSSATLKFVCKNNSEHIIVMNATVTTSVINGTCSNFVKTTYTATVSYEGTDYTDTKLVEVGTPDHSFSYKWTNDEHWQECVCGEKTDVTSHLFENATVTKAPSCGEAGESTSYCACGATKVIAVPATGNHTYQNDLCTVCGAKFVDAYYLKLVNSWKNINGFAIKIKDFSYEIKQQDSTLLEAFKLIGSIKQIDIAELALYMEDGKLGGAATGSIVIFNGPIANANAAYDFKAVIHNDYVYIIVKHGKDVADKDINIKISVDSLIDSVLDEAGFESEAQYALDFIKETLLPALDTFVEMNSEEANAFLEDMFNIMFTFEQQADGSYVATLDYGKLNVLNENLATKSVAEVVDIYFGEGTFDSFVEDILEILNLEASDIPAYLDKNGINSGELFAKINELAANTGAPADFDIAALINSDDMAGVTLGMLIFGVDDESYLTDFNAFISGLRENSLYALIGSASADEIKQAVGDILEMISDGITVSFTTDNSGMLASVNVIVDSFTYAEGNNAISLNFSLDIIINGRIDVTWTDIIDKIEADIVMPDDGMLENDIYSRYDWGYGGYVNYKGEEYYYSEGIRVYAYKTLYDKLTYIMFRPDCSGWKEYEAVYSEIAYTFTLATIQVDGRAVMLLIDSYTGEAVELVQTDTGFRAIFEDGTEKAVKFDFASTPADIAKAYTDIYFAVFDNPEGRLNCFGTYVDYYYNATLGEYSDSTHHNFKYEYVFDGENCEDGYTVYQTCADCGYEDSRYVNGHTYETRETDLGEYGLCGGYIHEEYCPICDTVLYAYVEDYECKWERTEADENGNETYVCRSCGTTKLLASSVGEKNESCEYTRFESYIYVVNGKEVYRYEREWISTEHNVKHEYVLDGETCEDGYTVYETCTDCGYANSWHGSGHNHDSKETDLGEYGLCGGYIYEEYCSICDTVLYAHIEDYECKWEHTKADTNGYETYVCRSCGATKSVTSSVGEKNENCEYTRFESYVYVVNGKEVYRYEREWISTEHNFKHEYVLDGETCEDGYTVYESCLDCGYEDSWHGSGHGYEIREIDLSEYGLCGGYIHEEYCPMCDTVLYSYVKDYKCEWEYTEADTNGYETYVCRSCGAIKRVTSSVGEKNESCEYTCFEAYVYVVNGKEVYRYEREWISTEHNVKHEYVLDGETCEDGYTVYETCLDCGYEDSWHGSGHGYETRRIELGEYGLCGGYIHEEYCPMCDTVLKSYIEDYECKWEHTEADENGNETYVCRSCGATKSVTSSVSEKNESCEYTRFESYVYVVNGKEVYRYEREWISTEHNFKHEYVLDGETCEDGYTVYEICTDCGYENSWMSYGHKPFELDRVDLSELGACYGEFVYYSCACGQEHGMDFSGCAYKWTNNEYYDDMGRLVCVEARTCSECGLRYECSYYTVRDRESCTLTYYYTVVISINGSLAATKEYTTVQEMHDYEITGSLVNGEGSSCEDGVTITYTCKDCKHSYSYEVSYHETFESEKIDLAQLGNICGGYASVYTCACGKYGDLSLDHTLCEWGTNGCDMFVENIVTGGQYDINGWHDYYYDSYIYTCAVTDPDRCAYKIRYATYWLKAADECRAYQYVTWQFGYNEETDTFLYEITLKTGNSRAYHNYIDGSTENCTKYDCPDCGSYYYENNYYDGEGNHIKYENIVCNTLNDGDDKYYEYVEEYSSDADGNHYPSREYSKRIYSDDSEYWYENLRTEQAYVGTFGEDGRMTSSSYTDSQGESYSEKYAYVYYKGYRFDIYSYKTEGDYWHKYDYSYTFDGECLCTEAYTDSNGENRTETYNICIFDNYITIKPATCTQDGEECRECVVCENRTDSYAIAPHDHDWMYTDKELYICYICGIENANGASGDIIMEDLTESYGNGENYVVGYYARNNVEFTNYVSLIFADEPEVVLNGIEFTTIDGIRAFAFSKEAVKALAVANGYADSSTYDVRFSFVPDGSDGSFDYGLTFTEKETDTCEHSYVNGACAICGEKQDGNDSDAEFEAYKQNVIQELTFQWNELTAKLEVTESQYAYYDKYMITLESAQTAEEVDMWQSQIEALFDEIRNSGNEGGDVIGCEHNYEEIRVNATCTADGYTEYCCTICGDAYTDATEPAFGHNYVNGACEICGDKQDGEIIAPVEKEVLYRYSDETLSLTLYSNGALEYTQMEYTADGMANKVNGEGKWYSDEASGYIYAYIGDVVMAFVVTENGGLTLVA